MKHFVPLLQTDYTLLSSLETDNPILMFGAGLYIRPTIHALSQHNRKPVAIIDNSPEKWNTKILDIPIISPSLAVEKFPRAIIIISAAPQYIEEIQKQTIELGWKSIFDCAALLANFSYEQHTFPTGISLLHFDLDRYFHQHLLINQPDKLVLRSLDIIITEKCSLKCHDCANLMQYYTDPQDLAIEPLIGSLDRLMNSIDHVMEFRVLGGETFINKNAHQYINHLRQYHNYTRIAVYSNGTIVPSGRNLDCLQYDDTYLRISDYGALSKNIRTMTNIFDKHDISYNLDKISGWQDCAEIKLRTRTKKELQQVYNRCCAKDTLSLLRGHLYICPFAANVVNLGALPIFPEETLNLNNKPSPHHTRKQLMFMLRKKTYFDICQYCAGRSDEDTPLPPAVQTKSCRPFKKFRRSI